MLFKELTAERLFNKINEITGCMRLPFTVFFMVLPKAKAGFNLKREYKPIDMQIGLYSQYHSNARKDLELVNNARNNLHQANYFGEYYNHEEGSLKFHISLNDIGNVDEEVIWGLVQLLKQESESEENNLAFHFKIIEPKSCNHERFSQNDQLTIYFDKYSSLGDMLDLAGKVDTYLKRHLSENRQPLGKKDSCDINSFVSARFDTNRLLSAYDVYPFFDLEIKKFLAKHSNDELRDVPICAIEAVFNSVISSKEITIPKSGSKEALNDSDSLYVQREFEMMLANPHLYLDATKSPIALQGIQGESDKVPSARLPLSGLNDTPQTSVKNADSEHNSPLGLDPTIDDHSVESNLTKSFEELNETSLSSKQPPSLELGFNMHTLSMAMKVMGGIAVALGIVALAFAAVGSPLMIAGIAAIGLGIGVFAGGFFVNKAEHKDESLDYRPLIHSQQ